jgi:hypothetical protein
VAALCDLAEVCIALQDETRADRLYQRLLPFAGHNAVAMSLVYYGSVSLYLGRLAHLLGRRGQAIEHLERAVAMNEKLGMVIRHGRACRALAGILAGENKKGALSRAKELLAIADKADSLATIPDDRAGRLLQASAAAIEALDASD